MACKKNQPGRPCCDGDGCTICTGTYNVLAITIGGDWDSFDGSYEDDSSGCPVPLIPGTFVLEYHLPKVDPIQVGVPVQCERKQRFYGERCDTYYYDAIEYSASSGYFTKKRMTIYSREWHEVRIHLTIKNISGVDRVILVFESWWMIDFIAKYCEYTTTATYGSLDDARTAELDDECLTPTAPVPWTSLDPYSESTGWYFCATRAVRRSSTWDMEVGSSCSTVCGDLGDAVITSERYEDGGSSCQATFIHQSPYFTFVETIQWERKVDGTVPAFGLYNDTVATVLDQPFDTDPLLHAGELTGALVPQSFSSVPSNADYLYVFGGGNFRHEAYNATLREPIWPVAPTATLVCE